MRDEQHNATPTITTTAAPATVATSEPPKWGDPLDRIPAERQRTLRKLADQQAEWAKQELPNPNQSPLAKAIQGSEQRPLTGTEVFFLAAYSLAGPDGDLEAEATRLRAVERDNPNTWVPLPNLHLEGSDLRRAHLAGAVLWQAHLASAIFRDAWLDSKTVLSDAILDDKTQLADIQWSGVGAVNLTQIRWEQVPRLGDERSLNRQADSVAYERVVRAYRQLAAQLRAQGMSEVADRFIYRAQVCHRLLQRRQKHWGGYLFSLLLAAMAGYGYRLGRIAVVYALVVVAFAASFLLSDVASGTVAVSGPSLAQGALDALQISLNAIHGRVFFVQFGLDTLQSWLATIESIFGIVIEGVFVAMLIQRFFGAK